MSNFRHISAIPLVQYISSTLVHETIFEFPILAFISTVCKKIARLMHESVLLLYALHYRPLEPMAESAKLTRIG